jgi:hypothetical protein
VLGLSFWTIILGLSLHSYILLSSLYLTHPSSPLQIAFRESKLTCSHTANLYNLLLSLKPTGEIVNGNIQFSFFILQSIFSGRRTKIIDRMLRERIEEEEDVVWWYGDLDKR